MPPAVTLAEPDDFQRFAVKVERLEHVQVDLDQLKALAGSRADQPAWIEQLDGMLAYAASKGWVNEDGSVRAHVEWS